MHSASYDDEAVPDDPLLRMVREENGAMFAEAQEAVRQRILRAVVREAVATLGRPEAIAEAAFEQLEDEQGLLHKAVAELKPLLLGEVARRTLHRLADADATARQARAQIEEDHEVLRKATKVLQKHLLGEIVQRTTDNLADARVAAHLAKVLVNDDNPAVRSVVAELKQRLIAEIARRSTDALADAEAVAREAQALISPEHTVLLTAIDSLKEQLLQTIVRESLTRINDEVRAPASPPTPAPPADSYRTTPQALKLHDPLHPDDPDKAPSVPLKNEWVVAARGSFNQAGCGRIGATTASPAKNNGSSIFSAPPPEARSITGAAI